MAKRSFALAVLLLFGATITTHRADAQSLSTDYGCAVLDDIVGQHSISAPVLERKHPVDHPSPDYRGAHSCSNSTATPSSDFRVSPLRLDIVTRRDGSLQVRSNSIESYY